MNKDIINVDFSEIEKRIGLTLNQPRQQVNSKLLDLHTITAALAFGVMYSKVTKDQRRQAKAINYSLMYTPDAKWQAPPEEELFRIYTDTERSQLCFDLRLGRPSKLYEAIQAHFNFGKS